MRVVTTFVGAVVEAWSELRVHRTRVLLSLIGIALAVAAITGVVAAGAVVEQAQQEQSERYGGRPARVCWPARLSGLESNVENIPGATL